MLVDTLRIDVQGGRGGHGCVSFRHERYAPRGGPDGGDGGDGGSVVAIADPKVEGLAQLVPHQLFRAERGDDGQGRRIHGRNGQDLLLRLPIGTTIVEAGTHRLLSDLNEADQSHVLAQGGKGGKGNSHFATASNRAPKRTTPGEPGQQLSILLEVKLPSDAALIGPPNSGKSSLLARLTGAGPRIAAYPFTTRQPEAGVLVTSRFTKLTILELPPLVKRASYGKGLGNDFLRHAERTRLLVLVIGPGLPGPRQTYSVMREELAFCGRDLERKPHMVVFAKADLWTPPDRGAFPDALAVRAVSASDDRSIQALAECLSSLLER